MALHVYVNGISSPPLALTKSCDDSGHVISVWQMTIHINMENLEEENREENVSENNSNNMILLGVILF